MSEIKVYLDTNILSRLKDRRINDEQAAAIDSLCDVEEIKYVVSENTLKEFMKTKDPKMRAMLKLFYRIITKVPYKPSVVSIAGWGTIQFGEASFGGGVEMASPKLTSLMKIFDQEDAEHIFQASESECKYFLSFDRALIEAAETAQIEMATLCPDLAIVDPKQFLELI